MSPRLHLRFEDWPLAICRLDPTSAVPAWAAMGPFTSVTRTPDELSIVTDARAVPEVIQADTGWRAIQLMGPFDFNLVGIMLAVLAPLAEAGVSILAVSTFDTDYVLVKAAQVDAAIAVLTRAGHAVERGPGL